MNILNDFKAQQKIDKSDLYGSIIDLSKQCSHAFVEANKLNIPDSYKNINKIVMAGMGGSGLGARLIESLYIDEIKYPLVRVNDYDLPAFADQNTLVICSSYSGTTEEILSVAKQAINKKTKWISISAGGTLHQLAVKHNVPAYKIDPIHNPCNQPRMAIGYSVIGQVTLASKIGLFKLTQANMEKMAKAMAQIISQNKVEVPLAKNAAKQLAQKFLNKQVVFVSAKHLSGAFHTVKNQLNENAKNFSHRHDIPELNHHLMEGLAHPNSQQNTIFWLALSKLYPQRIQQRFTITADVINQNHIDTAVFKPQSADKLSQAMELIQFGSFVNYYLTMLYGIDPAPIRWVDYFKLKLNQPLGK